MSTNEAVKSSQEYVNVPLTELVESSTNPRKTFDEETAGGTGRKHPQQRGPFSAPHAESERTLRNRFGSTALSRRAASGFAGSPGPHRRPSPTRRHSKPKSSKTC